MVNMGTTLKDFLKIKYVKIFEEINNSMSNCYNFIGIMCLLKISVYYTRLIFGCKVGLSKS